MTDPNLVRREQIRRALAAVDGFNYEHLEPWDYQSHADAILALPAVPVAAEEPVCICGHPVRRHFEDVCQQCDCGDCMEPAAAMEVIGRLVRAVRQRRAELAESRAVVLREAANALHSKGEPTCSPAGGDCCWYDAVAELRRMADEAQPPTPADRVVADALAALGRVRQLHDRLAEETDLSSPDDPITKQAAAERIAAALDGAGEADHA